MLIPVSRSFNRPDVDYLYPWETTDPTASAVTDTSLSWWKTRKYGNYDGEKIDRYYQRRRNREFLPYTNYFRWDESAALSGNESITHDTGTVIYTDRLGTTRLSPIDAMLGVDGYRLLLEEALEGVDVDDLITASAAEVYESFDTSTFLAELPETLRTILNMAKRLAHLKKGLLKRGISFEDALDGWLEWRYGWRTLLYDIDDLARALAGKDYFDISTARTGQKYLFTRDDVYTSVRTVFTVEYTITTKVTGSVRGSFMGKMDPPAFALDGFITTWELIPFSFVADWIFSIGDQLAALASLAWSTQHSACTGVYLQVERYLRKSQVVETSGDVISASVAGHLDYDGECKYRARSSVPLLPSVRLNFDVKKLLDAIALVVTGSSDPNRRF